MKAMKSMNMNRMIGSLRRKPRDEDANGDVVDSGQDTPEANAARNVKLFCESGGPQGSGEEVLYLPTIVEAAESSPAAAKECAVTIRKYLSKDYLNKPYIQYNAIMLIRILADNPGKTFTRNVDTKFVDAVKELLRVGRDPSVKQILMETLGTFRREKHEDEGLAKLIEMWKKEQERMAKIHGPTGQPTVAVHDPHFNGQNYFARNHNSRHLPNPQELASRIEEARNSAKLLSQFVRSTPPSELLNSDIIKEFADRCQSASRSVQAYMISENPAPDNNTMETLIETNEQLGRAMNQHQRAVLNARKAAGLGTATSPPVNDGANGRPQGTESGFAAPPGPPPSQASKQTSPITASVAERRSFFSRKKAPQIPPPGDFVPNHSDDEEAANPFNDPKTGPTENSVVHPPYPEDRPPIAKGQFNTTLGTEPYHPGFQETQSYVGRQDSSLGNFTMHTANIADGEEEEVAKDAEAETKTPVYRY